MNENEPIEGVVLVPIEEADALGIDYDIFDYEANITIGRRTFLKCKVCGEFAFLLNPKKTHMLVINTKYKGVIVEKIDRTKIN